MPASPAPPPRSSLGQNFLANRETICRIADAASITPDAITVELGIGRGALSREICRRAKKVIGIEKDKKLMEWGIENCIYPSNLVIIHGDILKVDFEEIARTEGMKLNIIGNLPYNISSQILVRLVDMRHIIIRATLMFQKEVAERLLASPGSKAYGALSVQTGYCFDISRVMDVSPGQFWPRPKVTSTVISLTPRQFNEQVKDFKLFRKLVKASFQHRRKKMLNSLKRNLAMGQDVISGSMKQSGIPLDARAEDVSVLQFTRLANLLAEKLR